MANEISTLLNFAVKNGTYSESFSVNGSFDQNAQGAAGGIASLTTTPSAADVGAVTTPGWLLLKNLDATNDVLYGPDSGGSLVIFGRVKPGEWAALRLYTTTTLKWRSSALTVKVQYYLFQD